MSWFTIGVFVIVGISMGLGLLCGIGLWAALEVLFGARKHE
jgi:hypothetical protein